MSDDPKKGAASGHGSMSKQLDAVCGAIREVYTGSFDTALELLVAVGYTKPMNLSELYVRANQLYLGWDDKPTREQEIAGLPGEHHRGCWEWEQIDPSITPVLRPGLRKLLPKVESLVEHPPHDFAAMNAAAQRALLRAGGAPTPEQVARRERQQQQEKENEARVARSLPRLAPVGPVAMGNL
jgi:hypothetical protein